MRRRTRVATATAGALLTLTAAGHLAGGWYYSGRIGQDALAVRHVDWGRPLNVEQASATSVTLRESGDADHWQYADLRSDGVFGLEWDGGYGRISGARHTARGRTTTDFEVIEGQPPQPGTRAAIAGDAYPDTLAKPWREVSYGEFRGQPLRAAYLAAKPGPRQVPSGTWAVLVHGKGATWDEEFHSQLVLRDLGADSISIRYRNDTDTAHDTSGRYGFGATEADDLAQAVDYVKSQGAQRVVLVGTSMGGAIVANYLQDDPQTLPVPAVILDAPALDLGSVVDWNARQVAPHLPGSISWVAKQFTSLRFGTDWGDVDYLGDLSWVRQPTLVFHGAKDLTVPISISRRLAEESDQVELIESPAAEHVRSWNLDPDGYDRAQREFLLRALG